MKDYATKVKQLLPEIRERRAEIEQARRLPADLAAKLRKTGIFALPVPKAIGGGEAPQADLMRLIELISAADGSTGWVTMIGLGNNLPAGFMNEIGAKEIFADPTVPNAGIAAPIGQAVRVEGGVRVTGRWPFASGITHVDWAWGGCLVMENGAPVMTEHGPEIIHVSFPVTDLEIHDTWYVAGLAGTGSNDFSVNDLFIPQHRVWALFDPSGHRPEPLYQMPIVAGFVTLVASVGLGIAREALDEIYELAQTKKPAMSEAVLADRPAAQIQLAQAEAALGAARAFLYDAVDDLWETVTAGREVSTRQNALARAAAINATDTAAAVTRTVNVLAGSHSVYSSSSLQRHARDAETVTHHFTVAQHTWEDIGRVLLGRAPVAPLF